MLLLAVGCWLLGNVEPNWLQCTIASQPIKEYRSLGCWWRWRWSNIVIYLILYGTFIIKFSFWIPVQIHLHTLAMVCLAPNFGISQQSNDEWAPNKKILSYSLINDKHHPSTRLILFFFFYFVFFSFSQFNHRWLYRSFIICLLEEVFFLFFFPVSVRYTKSIEK